MSRSPSRPGPEPAAETFDRAVGTYNEQIEAALGFSGIEHRLFIDGKARLIRELAAAHFESPSRAAALDLGCGIGNYHAPLAGAFASLDAVDVSEESLRYARQRHPEVRYTHYDGAVLPFADGRFDIVFTVCVMHHVPPAEWPRFAGEMRRVLAPGGLALVFEHNPLNPATQYIVRSCELDHDAVLLWPARLRSLFREAGFSAVATRTIFSVPPKGALLNRADWILGALPFGAQYYLSAAKPAATTRQAATA